MVSVAQGAVLDPDDGLEDIVEHGLAPCKDIGLSDHARHDFDLDAIGIKDGVGGSDFHDKDLFLAALSPRDRIGADAQNFARQTALA